MGTDTGVATFFTTHAALRAEKALQEAGIPGRLIPAPRALSADCTVALAFASSHEHRVRDILAAQAIEVSGFHHLDSKP
jgi:hypothetical protein